MVAVPTWLGKRLTKIGKKGLAATVDSFGESQQRIQPGVIGRLSTVIGKAFVNLSAAKSDVIGAIQR